jgi:hypothetical protein
MQRHIIIQHGHVARHWLRLLLLLLQRHKRCIHACQNAACGCSNECMWGQASQG